jgi:hypothetical protein
MRLDNGARMRSVAWTWFACIVFWSLFGACVEQPPPPAPPLARLVSSNSLARLVAVWDATACGDPHRVAVELYDDDGAELARSAPCTIGMLSIDVPHLGAYHGRVFGWVLGGAVRGEADVDVLVDQQVVRWDLPETP